MADGTSIDSLQIDINASASKANDAIDRLVGKLDRLQTSLGKVNGSQLAGLANGVDRLGKSMQIMNTIKTADFTRLATNLAKLGSINVSALNSSASSLSHLSRAFNTLGSVSQNTQSVVDMTNALARLGGAKVERAITNIPLLATAMNNLMVTLSQSPVVSRNIIDLTNALANFTAQASNISNSSSNVENGLNRTNRSVRMASKGFGGLASAIGKFYASYFLVVRGIKGLWKSIESTADYVEAFNYFNVALGKIGSDWSSQFEKYGYENAESYAESFATRLQSELKNLSGIEISIGTDGNGLLTESGLKNLGLNIQEITQYASQLASVTNSVGQTGEVSLAAASAFTKLGADISSLFNMDYSDVMKNLQSGLIGQSRALYRYGIDITNATLQTYAYELGLEKAVSEMTQAEKMQLRMIAILDQSKVSWGDLSRTINSPSNMMRQFTNNLKEVGMVLGQLFIPLLQKVMPVINGVTIALKRLLVNIAGFLGIQLDLSSFGQGYSDMGEDVDGLADSLDDATANAKKLKTATLGIDELNINAPQEDSGSGTSGVGGGIDLTKEILAATEEYQKVWDEAFAGMENKAQEFANKIEKIFEPITNPLKKMFKDISIGDWFAVGQDTSKVVSGLFDLLTKALKKVDWNELGNNIGEFLNGIDWDSVIGSVGNFIETLVNSAFEAWKASFEEEPIATTISSALIGWFAVNTLKINPKIAIGVITWEVFFDFGKKLAAGFAETEEEYQAIMNFSWFGEDGFFKNAFTDSDSAKEAFLNLFDYRENWFVAILARLFSGGLVAIIADIMIIWEEFLNWWHESGAGLWFHENVMPWFDKEKWAEITQGMKTAITDTWNDFSNWWKDNGASKWLAENVAPWFTVERWSEFGNNFKVALTNKWKEFSEWWKIELPLWLNENVAPWFTLEKWSGFAENIKKSLTNKWLEFSSWWTSNGVSKWFEEKVKPWFTKETWSTALVGIKTAFSDTFKGVANVVISWLNKVVGGIESIVNNAIKGLSSVSNILDKIPGVDVNFNVSPISLPRIPTYQIGGFPEDGLFMANHNELVGQFSNGRTAVANNEQIVDGIKYGVREAVAEILAPYLADIAQNTRETADKDLSVNIGDRDIARANARGQRSLGYALIT